MEKEIEALGKKVKVREIKYKDMIQFSGLSKEDAAKQVLLLAAGLTEEEYANLSLKDGVALQTAINEVNGLVDFQKPLAQ